MDGVILQGSCEYFFSCNASSQIVNFLYWFCKNNHSYIKIVVSGKVV